MPISDAVILVREGRIQALGPANEVALPIGATQVSLEGLFVTPGLINVHGHVGGLAAASADPVQEVRAELERYARFGVTTVNSQGGEPGGVQGLRHAVFPSDAGAPRARLLMAGSVVAGTTPEAVVAEVDRNAERGVDWIKIRVDDNLGTTPKMSPEIYRRVIEQAHEHELPLEAHLFYLEDAKGLLAAGADLIAHSIRDQAVDADVITALLERDVCYVPTLTREVSAFAYGETPAFLADPFLAADVDSSQVEEVMEPARQAQVAASESARAYRAALDVAQSNLDSLSNAGVRIAFGTDSGPLGRFQGYFEHMELSLMVESGLTPEEALFSATRDAAICLDRGDLGVLEEGRWADFAAFAAAPWDDISNTKTLARVWVGGNEISRP